MYLVNTRPDLPFAVNQLSQAMVQPTKLFLEGSEACVEIPQRHIPVWIVVQTDKGSEALGLHRCGLGRESIRPKEHF